MPQIINGVITQHENTNSFRYKRKHAKQGRVFTPAVFIIMGAAIVMGVFFFVLPPLFYELQTLFFCGVIGGIVIFVITHMFFKLRKKIHYWLAAALLLISGCLFSAFNIENPNRDLYHTASFFSGASLGLTILTFIIHSGEITVKYLRGSVITNIQMSIDGGIFIGLIYGQFLNEFVNPLLAIGILQIIFSILAFIITFFVIYESPIFLIEAHNEEEALKNLVELRNEPNNMSYEVQTEMEEIKAILKNKSDSIISKDEIIPFIKVLILRSAFALGTSVPINYIMVIFFTFSLNIVTVFPIYIARFFANILLVFLIDGFLGRKSLLIISFVGSGIILITSIALTTNGTILSDPKILGILAIIYFLFLGLGSSTVSYTYMSEVFNHSKKVYFNAIILILESIVHIIIINIEYKSFTTLAYLTGSLHLIIGVLSLFMMPETKGKTLMEAEDEMEKILNIKR